MAKKQEEEVKVQVFQKHQTNSSTWLTDPPVNEFWPEYLLPKQKEDLKNHILASSVALAKLMVVEIKNVEDIL